MCNCASFMRIARNDGGMTKKPAATVDGRLYRCAEEFRDHTWTQRLPKLLDQKRRIKRALGNDVGGDVADAGAGQSDGTGSARGEVEHAAPDEGPRSLIVTTTLWPRWVTRSLVPNGSERWAAVKAFWLKR